MESHQEKFTDRLFHSGISDSRNGTHRLLRRPFGDETWKSRRPEM
jgi:hypothetical protein